MKHRRSPIIFALVVIASSLIMAQDDVSDLLGRINGLRASIGRGAYSLNGALSAAAQSQAQWIADSGVVSHNRPDGSSPRARAINAGYPTSDVSENIYGGSRAMAGDAWNFWVNSDIHYRGLVNERYQEVGIGVGRSSWGTAYVLVFGNPGGVQPVRAGSGGVSAAAGPPQQPAYVLGLDEHGNILHEVQPGDTLGDMLLIYGYTWEMLPYIKEINGITENRELEIGSVIRIPPKDGTYTPTPGAPNATEVPPTTVGAAYPTPLAEDPVMELIALTALPATPALLDVTGAPSPVATAQPASTSTVSPAAIALAPTAAPNSVQTPVSTSRTLPTWLILGVVIQLLVLVGAGVEFLRRSRRP